MHFDGNASRGGTHNRDSADLGDAHDRSQVVLGENPLDGHTIGLVLFERGNKSLLHCEQSLSQGSGSSGFDHKDINEGQIPLGVDLDYAYATAR
jgi:hypothetical protein